MTIYIPPKRPRLLLGLADLLALAASMSVVSAIALLAILAEQAH